MAAAVLVLGVFAGFIMRSGRTSLPAAAADPSATPTSDDRGFVSSSARCEGSSTALAIVRTEGSLMVICVQQNGTYQYRGVRLTDGAALNLPADAAGGQKFVAHNDGINYAVSPKEFVITDADKIIRWEAVIDYRVPNPFPAEIGGTPAPSSTVPPAG
jgi:hypothetical protein